jgi:hypothetical protein
MSSALPMFVGTDYDAKVVAVPTAAVLKNVRAIWVERLNSALLSSALLPELIGVVADYAASRPPRWSASLRAPRVRLCNPLDEDGCSRTIDIEKYSRTRPEHKDTLGWQGAVSHEPLSTFPTDSDACVRWGFLVHAHSEETPSAVFGVARAGASVQPKKWGTDAHSWGMCVFYRRAPALVHAGQGGGGPFDSKPRRFPRAVWCTADLRTGTLSFALELASGERDEAPVQAMSRNWASVSLTWPKAERLLCRWCFPESRCEGSFG